MTKNSLTEGKIGRNLILFMLPVLAGSLIQQLYSTVDLILVGKFSGTEATAAIGSGDLIITCLIGFFNGMAVGTNVITAHIFGSKDKERLKRLVQTVFVLGMVGGLILMIIGISLAPTFLRLMNTPEAILSHAVIYLRIYMLSMISIVLYNLSSGIARAMGDSKTPMNVQLIGGVINVIADIILVAFFKTGVTGAAVATFLSQTTAALLMVYRINQDVVKEMFFKAFAGFDRELLGKILRIGIPSGIQAVVITFSNIIIQSQINKFGVDAIAAFAAYFKIELMVYLPILAMGQAVVSFVGQNYGAGQFERMKKGVRIALVLGIGLTLVIGLSITCFSHPIFGLFTSSAAAIEYGRKLVSITLPCYFIYSILECLGSDIRGKGEAFGPMLITVICFCVIRVVLLLILLRVWWDVRVVAFVYVVSWAIAACLMFIYKKIWERKKRI